MSEKEPQTPPPEGEEGENLEDVTDVQHNGAPTLEFPEGGEQVEHIFRDMLHIGVVLLAFTLVWARHQKRGEKA